MPRYFFDTCDGDETHYDSKGMILPSLHAAREEATETLTDMANDHIPGDGPQRKLVVRLRDETGKRVLEAALDFSMEPPA